MCWGQKSTPTATVSLLRLEQCLGPALWCRKLSIMYRDPNIHRAAVYGTEWCTLKNRCNTVCLQVLSVSVLVLLGSTPAHCGRFFFTPKSTLSSNLLCKNLYRLTLYKKNCIAQTETRQKLLYKSTWNGKKVKEILSVSSQP